MTGSKNGVAPEFVIDYNYTPQMVAECVRPVAYRRVTIAAMGLAVIYVVLLVLQCLNRQINLATSLAIIALYVATLIVFFFVTRVLLRNIMAKNECERLRMLYGSVINYHIEVADGVITVSSQKGMAGSIARTDIKKVFVTGNFIVVCTKGQMLIPMLKDGFVTGRADDLVGYLRG